MKAELVSRIYVKCPFCGEGKSRVCHLFGQQLPNTFGPWYCDGCGKGYTGTINSETDIDLKEYTRDFFAPSLSVLKLEPRTEPVYLVLKDRAYNGDIDKEYFFNEHTCPTNFMSQVEKIIDRDDYDPHGVFSFVGSALVENDFDFHDDSAVKAVVDEITKPNN